MALKEALDRVSLQTSLSVLQTVQAGATIAAADEALRALSRLSASIPGLRRDLVINTPAAILERELGGEKIGLPREVIEEVKNALLVQVFKGGRDASGSGRAL
jgi:hypothetical protein